MTQTGTPMSSPTVIVFAARQTQPPAELQSTDLPTSEREGKRAGHQRVNSPPVATPSAILARQVADAVGRQMVYASWCQNPVRRVAKRRTLLV
ncbi:unnamed protein product [Peronospora belbahrii]|uniref:Uncharacterized protein n=1 Tax=Peronospora belbahrii TaxID=622444 RepID=A0AAU9L779_9STRA|nr:unnamed protein product [Peronospora belbahrii]